MIFICGVNVSSGLFSRVHSGCSRNVQEVSGWSGVFGSVLGHVFGSVFGNVSFLREPGLYPVVFSELYFVVFW